MTARPSLATDDLEMHETQDGLIVYQESTDRVHYLNHTAAAILELCDGRRDVAEIAAEIGVLFQLDEAPVAATGECIEELVREGVVTLQPA